MPSKTKQQTDEICGTGGYTLLKYRDEADLPFLVDPAAVQGPLLLDMNVYTLTAKNKIGPEMRALLALSKDIYHSSVAIAEMKMGYAALDPSHPSTAANRAAIQSILDDIPRDRIIAPDHEDWSRAAVICGRLQKNRPDELKALFNDALILSTAQRQGMLVLTNNKKDFDLLTQVSPGNLLLFRQT